MFIYNSNGEKIPSNIKMGFSILKYTDKSIVVRGDDTKDYKEQFKKYNGKWNTRLTGGPGWIFSKKYQHDLEKLQGKKSVSSESIHESSHELPPNCKKYSAKIKNIPKELSNIQDFCSSLCANKVKESKEKFLKLSYIVQCMFLEYAWNIISAKTKHSDDSYLTAFRLFKLFRGKDMKEKPIYARYLTLKSLEPNYKKALEWNRKSPVSTKKSPSVSAKTKYDKEYQRKPEPVDDADPLRIFYVSLYLEKPSSPLAITWLTEHGVYDGEERKQLIKKYKKLADKNGLIR